MFKMCAAILLIFRLAFHTGSLLFLPLSGVDLGEEGGGRHPPPKKKIRWGTGAIIPQYLENVITN